MKKYIEKYIFIKILIFSSFQLQSKQASFNFKNQTKNIIEKTLFDKNNYINETQNQNEDELLDFENDVSTRGKYHNNLRSQLSVECK